MEKYAVDEDVNVDAMEKAAAEGCPQCGSKHLKHYGKVVLCPNCGSKPFEKEKLNE